MIVTLAVLAYVCALSLFFVLVIPPLAPTKLFMRFTIRTLDFQRMMDPQRSGSGAGGLPRSSAPDPEQHKKEWQRSCNRDKMFLSVNTYQEESLPFLLAS